MAETVIDAAFASTQRSYRQETARDAEQWGTMNVTKNPLGAAFPDSCRDRIHAIDTRPVLQTADITGTGPRALPKHQRETFHDNRDILGTTSRQLHTARSGHHQFYDLSDIAGTSTKIGNITTSRVVDPLAPVYKLPSTDARPPTPPKFKRDLHSVDDIAGTKPAGLLPWATRDNMNKREDIEGTVPRHRTRTLARPQEQELRDSMNVRDVNQEWQYRSNRITDPLDPRYVVHGQLIVDDPLSKTMPSKPQRPGPFLSLHTQDIEGAYPGRWGNLKIGTVKLDDWKDWQVTNDLSDLPRARANTRKPGLSSERDSDPNEREYWLLEGRELGPDELAIGRNKSSAAATLIAKDAERAVLGTLRGQQDDQREPARMVLLKERLDPSDQQLAQLRGTLSGLRKARSASASATLRNGGPQSQALAASIRMAAAVAEGREPEMASTLRPGETLVKHRGQVTVRGRSHAFIPLIQGETKPHWDPRLTANAPSWIGQLYDGKGLQAASFRRELEREKNALLATTSNQAPGSAGSAPGASADGSAAPHMTTASAAAASASSAREANVAAARASHVPLTDASASADSHSHTSPGRVRALQAQQQRAQQEQLLFEQTLAATQPKPPNVGADTNFHGRLSGTVALAAGDTWRRQKTTVGSSDTPAGLASFVYLTGRLHTHSSAPTADAPDASLLDSMHVGDSALLQIDRRHDPGTSMRADLKISQLTHSATLSRSLALGATTLTGGAPPLKGNKWLTNMASNERSADIDSVRTLPR